MKQFFRLALILILIQSPIFLLSSCAYRLGSPDRSLSGGYKQLTIPIFRNMTQETGIEVAFTNALIQEFQRTKTGRVVEPSQAEVQVDGEISSIQYLPGGKKEEGSLPTGAVLASAYTILLKVKITVHRFSDRSVLWQGTFSGERSYTAPQVTQGGLNTVNPLYNLSARRQNIDAMALDMMAEAHDRMTENF